MVAQDMDLFLVQLSIDLHCRDNSNAQLLTGSQRLIYSLYRVVIGYGNHLYPPGLGLGHYLAGGEAAIGSCGMQMQIDQIGHPIVFRIFP